MGETLLSREQVEAVRMATAVLGTGLLLGRGIIIGRGLSARGLDAALALLGLLAAAGYWNLFQFHYPGFGHPSDTYHYYVGGKYYPELGHTRLYSCTAVAEAEAGGRFEVEKRHLRNLETNQTERTSQALAHPEQCKDHFTPARWQAFQKDIVWFRSQVTAERWSNIQVDHGYNGTPVWGLIGGALANLGPASKAQVRGLRLLDPVLLALAWASVFWAFGWRVACVGLLYWGTNYPNQFGWVGGSYLRQVDLAALLIGLSLLRRQHNLAAGFALGFASLARIYPGVLFAGAALQVVGDSWRERRFVVTAATRRLALGGLLAAALFLPTAAFSTGGFESWRAFAEIQRIQAETPMRNHFGLRTLLSWRADEPDRAVPSAGQTDPYGPWKDSRRATFAARRWVFAGLVAGAIVVLGFAVQRQPLWAATALAAGLIPVLGELTSYYASALVVLALLWARFPPIGIGIVALSAIGWAIVAELRVYHLIFTGISLATVLLVALAWIWAWKASPRES